MDTNHAFAFLIIMVKAAIVVILLEQNIINKGVVWLHPNLVFQSNAATPTSIVPSSSLTQNLNLKI
jgi:hypothetical protein